MSSQVKSEEKMGTISVKFYFQLLNQENNRRDFGALALSNYLFLPSRFLGAHPH